MSTNPFNFGGSNQYGQYPMIQSGMSGMSGNQIPGIPTNQGSPQGTPPGVPYGANDGRKNMSFTGALGQAPSANRGYYAGQTLDPALTGNFFNFLQSQIGEGVGAFNWASILPTSGQATQNGQLTAPENQTLQSIIQAFSPGGTMGKMAQTGDPTDVGPAWQAMLAAQQENIQQKQAQMKENMNVGGNLAGSPFGTALQNFQTQTALGQNAMLTEAQQQAQEAAKSRILPANQMMAQLSQYLQGLDQASIDRLYQEFQRTQVQNNPMLAYQAQAATTFPPYLKKAGSGGGLAAMIGQLGQATPGIIKSIGGLGGGGGAAIDGDAAAGGAADMAGWGMATGGAAAGGAEDLAMLAAL